MIRQISANFIQTNNNTEQKNIKKTNKTEQISRAEEIKKEIQNGTYKIDLEKTAEAMAKSLL